MKPATQIIISAGIPIVFGAAIWVSLVVVESVLVTKSQHQRDLLTQIEYRIDELEYKQNSDEWTLTDKQKWQLQRLKTQRRQLLMDMGRDGGG